MVEKDVNLTMAKACCEMLVQHGIDVKMSRTADEDDPLTDEIKECNAFNPDLAVDVHNNSGGGDGFEAFYHYKGGTGKILAENIEAEVIKIGQNSRGCKTRVNSSGADYYGFIRQIKCPSIIVEGVFVDNKTDVQIADTVEEQKEFGKAYARGILKTLGVAIKESSVPAQSGSTNAAYYVQVGVYSQKENAEAQLEKAKAAGFNDAFIKTF